MRSDVMKHKKYQHPNKVTICNKYKHCFTCHFGEQCWYKHEENMEETSVGTMELQTKYLIYLNNSQYDFYL